MDANIYNIVFDVGMVLIDFCWEKHCRRLGFDEAVIHAFDVNMIHSQHWSMLDEGLLEEEEAISQFLKCMPSYQKEIMKFWEQPEYFVEEYDYAAPMISRLKNLGYHVYLLSNYPYNLYKIHWPSFEFYSMVDGYVVSAAEKLRKPNPAIYKLLCNRYQLKPKECLFIDDRPDNVEAAMQVGMKAVLFEGYESLKAYLEI